MNYWKNQYGKVYCVTDKEEFFKWHPLEFFQPATYEEYRQNVGTSEGFGIITKSREDIIKQANKYEEELKDIQAYSTDATESQRERARELYRSLQILRWVLGFQGVCPK